MIEQHTRSESLASAGRYLITRCFSKNRYGRFQESNLFQELFERIVETTYGWSGHW
jgi:hypothetical protein